MAPMRLGEQLPMSSFPTVVSSTTNSSRRGWLGGFGGTRPRTKNSRSWRKRQEHQKRNCGEIPTLSRLGSFASSGVINHLILPTSPYWTEVLPTLVHWQRALHLQINRQL